MHRPCPTHLIILRHGETVDNAAGRWQGHRDGALSDLGRAQAAALGRRLKSVTFAALYSSDLARARDTAQAIAAETGHSILLDSRLRERHFGVFQGLPAEGIEREFPAAWQAHKSGDPDFVVPKGESARHHYDRSMGCLEELARRHAGQTIAVVSHGGVLSGLLRRAAGIPLHLPRGFVIPNAGYNVFGFVGEGEGRWILKTWGDVSHLD